MGHYNFSGALAASRAAIWADIVGHVCDMAYEKRGYGYTIVEEAPIALQRECVDYLVTLKSMVYSGDTYQLPIELKTDKNEPKNIVVERYNSIESSKPGWPFKPITVHTQRLMTVFIDGTVFFPYLDTYQCWLHENVARWDVEVGKEGSSYRRILLPNPGYTTASYLIPLPEVRQAMGDACFYQLEGEWLAAAQAAIRRTSEANELFLGA